MATLTVTPNPAHANSEVSISGSGYSTDNLPILRVTYPDGEVVESGTWVWGNGTLGPMPWVVEEAGAYHLETLQRKGKSRRYTKLATAELTVI